MEVPVTFPDVSTKPDCCRALGKLAGGLGFEPRLAESESAVLPLDDPPTGPDEKAFLASRRGKARFLAHTDGICQPRVWIPASESGAFSSTIPAR